MYALIIIITGYASNSGSSVTNIPGFESMAKCQESAAFVIQQSRAGSWHNERAYCIRVK